MASVKINIEGTDYYVPNGVAEYLDTITDLLMAERQKNAAQLDKLVRYLINSWGDYVKVDDMPNDDAIPVVIGLLDTLKYGQPDAPDAGIVPGRQRRLLAKDGPAVADDGFR